ncbi:MAG TPA: S8 family serine peptidase [Thermotogota bacterium]|nr:S8 family serine peptidase [Thermotogota bacterium]
MKKTLWLSLIVVVMAFAFTSCTNIPSGGSNGLVVPPDIFNFSEGDYYEGVLNIGYTNYDQALRLVDQIDGIVQKHVPQIQVFSVTFSGTVAEARIALEKALNEHNALKDAVRYIEPSFKRTLVEPIKNDAVMSAERDEDIPDLEVYNWGSRMVKAPEAWAAGYTGDGVIVAVVDTGVDMTHPDLINQCIGGYAPYTETILAPATDHSQGVESHGTHVSGTIAAENNGFGITGIAYNAQIMNIRIFDDDCPDSYIGDIFVAAGLVWAVEHGAQVTNNSWGGKGYSNTLLDGFNYGLKENVIHVTSEGNDHVNAVMHPSAYPGMVNVAACTATKGITNFSSRGQWLTVAAPGDFTILSTVPLWDLGEFVFEQPYALYGGTSMASPHVTGVIALLIEKLEKSAPAANSSRAIPYTPYQIRKIIELGAEDIMAPGFDEDSGWGIVQADTSLAIDIGTVEEGADLVVNAFTTDEIPLPGLYVTIKPKGFIAPEFYGKTNALGVLEFCELVPGEYDFYFGWLEGMDPMIQDGMHAVYELASGLTITITIEFTFLP